MSTNKEKENHECIFDPFAKTVKEWHEENEKAEKDNPDKIPEKNIVVFGCEVSSQTEEGYHSHQSLITTGSLAVVKECIVNYALEDNDIARLITEAGKEIMIRKMLGGL